MNRNQSILQQVSRWLQGTSAIDCSWCPVEKTLSIFFQNTEGLSIRLHTFYSVCLKSVGNRKNWVLGVLKILSQKFFQSLFSDNKKKSLTCLYSFNMYNAYFMYKKKKRQFNRKYIYFLIQRTLTCSCRYICGYSVERVNTQQLTFYTYH